MKNERVGAIMSVSAETYIVISLMFAVFAAVAAVGTSIVLGAGFERLRVGFEIVRKQTGFFADAIHKLDQRTARIGEDTAKVKESVSYLSDKVERVEKQTGFFSDALHTLEQKILDGAAAQAPVQAEPDFDWIALTSKSTQASEELFKSLSLSVYDRAPEGMQQSSPQPVQDDEDHEVELEAPSAVVELRPAARSASRSNRFPDLFSSYFRDEGRDGGKQVVYH